MLACFLLTVTQHSRWHPAKINQANRLLFSLLSNPKFQEWGAQFAQKRQQEIEQIQSEYHIQDAEDARNLFLVKLDRSKIYREIAEAFVSFSDIETIYSMLTIDHIKTVPQRLLPGTISDYAYDVAVDIETFIYAVAALAVFVAGVIALVVGVLTRNISRDDLLKVSHIMVEELNARAQLLRERGSLTSFESVQKGTIL